MAHHYDDIGSINFENINRKNIGRSSISEKTSYDKQGKSDEKFEHLMIDLETMGKRAGCAIVSIGAIEFNLKTGKTGREFYERINLQSCLNLGLFVDASTIYWWMQQNEEARNELCKPSENIRYVLQQLSSFIGCMDVDFKIWGNGARFDIAILESAYFACGHEILPWKFVNERDVRTLVSFAPQIKELHPFKETKHNPINDCKHQISYCSAIWNLIKT